MPLKNPRSLDELCAIGGPATYIAAAEKAAGDAEARRWLSVLEGPLRAPEWQTIEVDGFADTAAAKFAIKTWTMQLRRRLGLKTPPDTVRRQTRERVRRHRARARQKAG
jgi:hypothetical protein